MQRSPLPDAFFPKQKRAPQNSPRPLALLPALLAGQLLMACACAACPLSAMADSGVAAGHALAAPTVPAAAGDAASRAAEDARAALEEAARPSAGARRFDVLGLPLVTYNSDEKCGFGAAGAAYFYGMGVEPYAHAITAQIYFTTARVQSHFVHYDAPQFLGSIFRLEAQVEFRREKFAPFFGLGNSASPGFSPGRSAGSTYYSWDRLAYGGWARVRAHHPWGIPLEPWLGLGFRDTRVRPYDGSLLEQEHPRGLGGGLATQLWLGLLHDTRDSEISPTRGGLREIALRVVPRFLGSSATYGQLTLAARQFFPLTGWLALGVRAVGDWIFGAAPFFELSSFGGIGATDGLGGMGSVRGLSKQRYVGSLKFLLNLELRAIFWRPVILGHEFSLAAVAFGDAGRVYEPGTRAGAWYRFHAAGGIGLRIVKGAAVIRLDYGISEERQSIYLTLGQMF